MSVPVNASGKVVLGQEAREQPADLHRFRLRQRSDGLGHLGAAARGIRQLYAVQGGKRSNYTIARVHRGYGAGGFCFAL